MFGQALKLLRRYQGLNQSNLAKQLGVSRSYVSELESGNRTPSLDLLSRYADVFNVPVSSLVFFAEALEDKENLTSRLDKAKGVIEKVVDRYVAHLRLNQDGVLIKIDQEDLETVVPQVSSLMVA